MINYKRNTWADVNDTSNRIPISARNLNNIEDGLQRTADMVDEIKPRYIKACNVTKKLKEISPSSNGSSIEWVATEDCWLGFYISGTINNNDTSVVKVDGVVIFSAEMDACSTSVQNSFMLPPSFFVKQGATITVTKGEPDITCTVYGCY